MQNLFICANQIVTGEIYVKMPGGEGADKTNTALLLDQQGNFVAFGSRALDAYFEDNNDGKNLLFERFKMGLDCSQGNVQTNATALNGIYLFSSRVVGVLTLSYTVQAKRFLLSR
jgi:hypothetical protein